MCQNHHHEEIATTAPPVEIREFECSACGIVRQSEPAYETSAVTWCEYCATECSSCGIPELNTEMARIDGQLYCQNCATECSSCGTRITMEESLSTTSGQHRCSDCAATCEACEDTVGIEELGEVNVRVNYRHASQTWCRYCRGSNAFVCGDCGETFHDDLACGCNTCDQTVCESCAENYFTCDSCDQLQHVDQYGQDGYCQTCYDRENEIIHPYSYKPQLHFIGGARGKDCFLGWELEVEMQANSDREIAACAVNDMVSDYAYLKEDSSLNNGFEIVSHPMTLAKHRELTADFFKRRPQNLKCWKSQNCGLHVHVSRNVLSQLQIGKMLVFVNLPANTDYIRAIAQRDSSFARRKPEKKISNARKSSGDRYEALNLLNRTTVEFRIFKGTLNHDSFMRALEFCRALVAFTSCANTSIKDAERVQSFVRFVAQNRKEYPILAKFHIEKGFDANTTKQRKVGK